MLRAAFTCSPTTKTMIFLPFVVVVLNRDNFLPQGIFGNIWRHSLPVTNQELVATGYWHPQAQDATKHLLMYKKATLNK